MYMPDYLFQTKLLHKIEILYGGHTGISIFIAFASTTTYCILFPITYERSLMCMHEGLPKFSVLILKKKLTIRLISTGKCANCPKQATFTDH